MNKPGFVEVIFLILAIPCAFIVGRNFHFIKAQVNPEKVSVVMGDMESKQAFFALNVGKLIHYINAMGYSVTLGEAWRPEAMAEIYAKEGKGIMHSQHTKRLAIDLNIFDSKGRFLNTNNAYKPFGDYWESLCNANRWGGNFTKEGGHINDSDHFEMRG
jgi:hypothetical protein